MCVSFGISGRLMEVTNIFRNTIIKNIFGYARAPDALNVSIKFFYVIYAYWKFRDHDDKFFNCVRLSSILSYDLFISSIDDESPPFRGSP